MLYTSATSNPAARARSAAPGFSPPALAEWADTSSDTIPAAPRSIPPDFRFCHTSSDFPNSLHIHRSDVKSRGRAHPFQADRPLQPAFL